jgi:hypothetical protein
VLLRHVHQLKYLQYVPLDLLLLLIYLQHETLAQMRYLNYLQHEMQYQLPTDLSYYQFYSPTKISNYQLKDYQLKKSKCYNSFYHYLPRVTLRR